MISKLNLLLLVLMGLIVMITASPDAARCAKNCKCRQLGQTTKKYYVATHFKLNWYQAYEYCRRHEMQLATISTKEKSDAINIYLKEQGLSTGRFWTAGTDLGEESKFYWMSTGERFTFSNWIPKPQQPDNYGGKEHCVELIASEAHKYLWNDMPCDFKLNFICEKCVRKPVDCPKCGL